MQITEYSQHIYNWLYSTEDKITSNFHFYSKQ